VPRLPRGHEIEPAAPIIPALERCHLNRDPFAPGQFRHPRVDLDAEDARAASGEHSRRDPGTAPHVEHIVDPGSHQLVEQRGRI
jgi:hypothetical protein